MVERQVSYDLEVVEEIPERASATSKPSPLEAQLEAIKHNPSHHAPKWGRIGRYASSVSATAAASTLRGRHGDTPKVTGWRFETRRIDNGEATGLFAQYDPSKVVPGEKEAWLERREEKYARLAEARRVKAEQKAREDGEHQVTAQGKARVAAK